MPRITTPGLPEETAMEVQKIYKKLLAYFGPQGWWPIFDKSSQSCQYFTIGYQVPNSFEICVGAILTQNTAWKNVEKALCDLINVGITLGLSLQLEPQFILSCKNLEKLIQSAGYYNQKAKKLRIFSEFWINNKNLSEISLKALRLQLTALWGIGPETADSMLLYAFNKPIFVIDTYTRRLCKECGVEFKIYDEYRHFFETQLPKSVKIFKEYHALIVAWGKLYAKNKKESLKIIS